MKLRVYLQRGGGVASIVKRDEIATAIRAAHSRAGVRMAASQLEIELRERELDDGVLRRNGSYSGQK